MSRDCTVTVLVSQIKRGHVTALYPPDVRRRY